MQSWWSGDLNDDRRTIVLFAAKMSVVFTCVAFVFLICTGNRHVTTAVVAITAAAATAAAFSMTFAGVGVCYVATYLGGAVQADPMKHTLKAPAWI